MVDVSVERERQCVCCIRGSLHYPVKERVATQVFSKQTNTYIETEEQCTVFDDDNDDDDDEG